MTVKRRIRDGEFSADDYQVETTTAANCLMLLSRVGKSGSSIDGDDTSVSAGSDSADASPSVSAAQAWPSGRVFQCKTCDKKFHSFQALGGHRASHKKLRLVAELLTQPSSPRAKVKKHECPICGLEFPLGQALGGHMRRHRAELLEEKRRITVTDGAKTTADDQNKKPPFQSVLKRSNSSKRVFGLDLNLMPHENDDLRQETTKIQTAAPILVHCFI